MVRAEPEATALDQPSCDMTCSMCSLGHIRSPLQSLSLFICKMGTITPAPHGCEDKIVCLVLGLVHSERTVTYSTFWSMPQLPQF